MKLFGSRRKAQHNGGRPSETAAPQKEQDAGKVRQAAPAPSGAAQPAKKGAAKKKLSKPLRIVLIILAVVAALGAAGVAYWMTSVKPPSVAKAKDSDVVAPTEKQRPTTSSGAVDESETPTRNSSKYTFVVVGMDDGNGNTDTIMVATFDASAHTLNVVNIPRDTLVNVSWYTKKVNSLYANGGIDRLQSGLADILGYELDHYAIIDLDAFIELVDAVGGVTFDVPQDMDYDDPAQDLYIHVSKGVQTLDGKTAMGVVRFRHGYADADIGRIRTQQAFMKTLIQQILDKRDSISITTLAKIFIKDVKTDLTYGNIIWFGKELVKLTSDGITFQTMPGNIGDSVNGSSYVTIYVNQWLEMINAYLNPFDTPIKESDLNVLTRNSAGALYSTSGKFAGDSSWGRSSGSTSKSSSAASSSKASSSSKVASSSETASSSKASSSSAASSSKASSSSAASSSKPSSSSSPASSSSKSSSSSSSKPASSSSKSSSSSSSSKSSGSGTSSSKTAESSAVSGGSKTGSTTADASSAPAAGN